MTNRFYSLLILCLLLFLVSACDFAQPVPTPILVTATPEFLIVTSTPLPTTTQVLLPTLPVEEIGLNLTATPTSTPTQRITNTPTFTPTPTDTPATPGAIIGLVGGGSVGGASTVCTSTPQGGFGSIYSGNPQIATQLGCPIGGAVPINNAYQTHERGAMIWISSLGESPQEVIYAIGNNGTYQRYNDTWLEGVEPEITGLTPPQANLMEPKRGFGKVWREAAGVRDNIGWATSGENGGSGIIQLFERGEMLYVPQSGQTYVLITGAPGTWSSVAQPY